MYTLGIPEGWGADSTTVRKNKNKKKPNFCYDYESVSITSSVFSGHNLCNFSFVFERSWLNPTKNEQYVSSPQISETEGKTRRSGPNWYLIDWKLRLSPTRVGYARSDFDHILQYSEVLVLSICALVCWLACLKAQPNRLNLKKIYIYNKKMREEKKSQTYQNETKHWTQILES